MKTKEFINDENSWIYGWVDGTDEGMGVVSNGFTGATTSEAKD